MIKDLLRLAVGLAILGFHKPIADYVLAQERQLVEIFSRRGWNVPTFRSEESARDLYFCLGAFICLVALLRIWFGA